MENRKVYNFTKIEKDENENGKKKQSHGFKIYSYHVADMIAKGAQIA